MTEEEIVFDKRQIPELQAKSNDNNSPKNPYAKRYMVNKINVVVNDEVTKKMREIKNKRKFKSDSDTIKYLCDLEIAIDPIFKTQFKCKTCNETLENVPTNININRFLHDDLCRTSPCKGHIIESNSFDIDKNGNVKSNKNKANGTNDSNDKNSEATDAKEREKTPEEIEKEAWENNPINPKNYKIDPNVKPISFFDIGKEQSDD
jgi:hypothetical protein